MTTLTELYERLFPDPKALIWFLPKAPDADVSGAGVLLGSADSLHQLKNQNLTNKWTVHVGTSMYHPPTVIKDRHLRADLQYAGRYFIVVDVDDKDQVVAHKDIVSTLKLTNLSPSAAVETANGYHFYYVFDTDILQCCRHIFDTICELFKSVGIVPDENAGRHPRGTIRLIGAMLKDGRIPTVMSLNGPTYNPNALAQRFGLTGFSTQEPVSVAVVPDSPLAHVRRSIHSSVSRDMLIQACGAYAAFLTSSKANFQAGSEGGYSDVRMFSSLTAHAYNPLDRSEEERRDFARDTMMQYPNATAEWVLGQYDSVTDVSSFHCDKWGPYFGAACGACQWSKHKTNPITAAGAQFLTPIPVSQYQLLPHKDAPARAELSEWPSTHAYKPIADSGGPVGLPAGYRLVSGNLNFDSIKKGARNQPDTPTTTTICSPGVTVLSRDVVATSDRTVYGYSMQCAKTAKIFLIQPQSLNSSTVLANDMSAAGIHIKDPRLLQTYINDCCEDMTRDAQVSGTLGWADANTRFVMPEHVISFSDIHQIKRSASVDGLFGDAPSTLGTLEGWVSGVLQPLIQGGPDLHAHLFHVLSALSAPLYARAVQDSGAVFSLHGERELGKSSALMLGCSSWHEPTAFTLTGEDTAAGRLGRLATMKNLPISFDEVTAADPDMLYKFVYMFTTGQDKASMTGITTVKQKGRWQTITLATANRPIRQLIMQKAGNNAAVYDRVCDIEIPSRARKAQNRLVLDRAVRAARGNYGTAGLFLASYLIRQGPDYLKMMEEQIALRQDHIPNRFIARQWAMLDMVMAAVSDMGWANQDDFDSFRDWLVALAKDQIATRDKMVHEATASPRQCVEAFASDAVPRDAAGYKTYMGKYSQVSGRNPVPALHDFIYEDDDYFYVPNQLIVDYANRSHRGMTVNQVKQDWEKSRDMPTDFRRMRLPIISEPYMGVADMKVTSVQVSVARVRKD